MSGENSEAFTFLNNNSYPRSTVTSIQSPFAFPNSTTGSTDTLTYPTGNSSATPPHWFFYSNCPDVNGDCKANDITGNNPGRAPAYGQTSSQKSAVIGVRAKAAFQDP